MGFPEFLVCFGLWSLGFRRTDIWPVLISALNCLHRASGSERPQKDERPGEPKLCEAVPKQGNESRAAPSQATTATSLPGSPACLGGLLGCG